jgi:hypothetical protein
MSDHFIENNTFVELAKTAAGRDEIQEKFGLMCRSKVRENSFTDIIIQPAPVDPATLKPSKDFPGPTTFVYLEPNSQAFTLGWRQGAPFAQQVTAAIAEIGFLPIAAPEFYIMEEELMAYNFPITKVIEDNLLRDIHEAKDSYFSTLCYQAVAATGNWTSYTGTFDKTAMKYGFNFINYNQLQAETMLIPNILWNDVNAQGTEFFGSNMNSQVVTSGYTASTFGGRRIIQSNKVRQLSRNPYSPANLGAITFTGQDVPGSNQVGLGTPYDPFYKIGVNLNGLPVNGEGSSADGVPLYPAKDIANGYYVAGLTNLADAAITIGNSGTYTNGFTAWRNGTTFASTATTIKASLSGPLGPSSKAWLGNTALFFTDEKFLGKNYILKDVQFGVKQDFRKLTFSAWKLWTSAIINMNSVSQVTVAPVLP